MDRFWRWLRFNMMYFGQPPWDTQVTPPELARFTARRPAGRALDLGCGTGTNLVFLAKAGWQVSGVDFALKAVNTARARLKREGVEGRVEVGDVTRLDHLTGPYELVLDIGCYHSIQAEGRMRYRKGLERLLAQGGSFLIYAHQKEQPEARIGLDEADIAALATSFKLDWREDSPERRGRKAVWMEWIK